VEGLSLAHVEALVAGVPVVATDAGGTAELACAGGSLEVLPTDADADVIAAPSSAPARQRRRRRAPLLPGADGRGLRAVAPRALARRAGRGVVLVRTTSSSAARSRARGASSKASAPRASPREPSRSRSSPPTDAGARRAPRGRSPRDRRPAAGGARRGAGVLRVLDAIEEEPPAAVVFWNVIAEHKVLLADALFGVPVFDVKPRRDVLASLARYFERPRAGSRTARRATTGRASPVSS